MTSNASIIQLYKVPYTLDNMPVEGSIPDWGYPVVISLLEALKVVDPLTYKHCLRVGIGAKKFAQALGLPDYHQKVIEFSGFLHDIGKIGIPHSVVHKPGKLNDEENQLMKTHVELSINITSPLAEQHVFFAHVLPAIRYHHERIDGIGYPFGLKENEIPLLARILSIIDTVDAMSQDRSYRRGLPFEVIYDEINRCSGTQFDTQLARFFIESHPHWKQDQLREQADAEKVLLLKVS